jgi:hypothetical protein
MIDYKFTKTFDGTVVHMILEDNIFHGIATRPPTNKEIAIIEERKRKEKVIAILKDYAKHKKDMNVQVTVKKHSYSNERNDKNS